MIPYEDISNVDPTRAVFAAERILENGWSRRGYPTVQLDAIPWELETQDDRSWNFYIHSWDMLDSLLKAYSETREKRFLLPAIQVALDWASQNTGSRQEAASPFAWYDMAVGLRAYRLSYLIDAGAQAGVLTESEIELLWGCLEQHRLYLRADENIAFHNNHGYYQVAGQLAMGRRFASDSEEMAEAFRQGTQRLDRMLVQQFGKEGVHREHSPDYHRMVYDTFNALLRSGLVENPSLIKWAEQIESCLSWFITPDQHIATFGDSDYRKMRRKAAEAQRKWRTPAMRYVVTGGEVGELPPEEVKVFPETGYFIVRRNLSGDLTNFAQTSYLAQMAGFHSRSHKHADDLSMIWCDRGSRVLVDSGRYGYIGKAKRGTELWRRGFWYTDPNRVYCESTHAHNCVEFDGMSYARRGVRPYGSALRRWGSFDQGIVAVESECKHFGSIRYARTLVFNPRKWLVVFDWFYDNHEEKHDVRQWFHLAPELQLIADDGGFLTWLTSSAEPLRIVSLLAGPTASRLYIGETEPRLQGWISPKEREMIPSYAFAFEIPQESHGSFGTLFSFSQALQYDQNRSEINVSGRNGRFRWLDEAGAHLLQISRPQEGELDVSYELK